jgi:hypothetical protein
VTSTPLLPGEGGARSRSEWDGEDRRVSHHDASAPAARIPAPVQPGVDLWLLERLVCPVTRTPLRYDEAAQELISEAAALAYPIRDGVPVMLVEEARSLAG